MAFKDFTNQLTLKGSIQLSAFLLISTLSGGSPSLAEEGTVKPTEGVAKSASEVAKPAVKAAPITSANAKVEKLRATLFAGSLNTRRCLTLPKSLKNSSKSIDSDLDQFINTFKSGIETLDSTKLLPLFHPRIVTNLAPVDDLLASMKLTLRAPFEVSTFRLWAINTVDGNPEPLVCGGLEHTELQFWPQFGYNLEFAVWIQILGKSELGRIFTTIVNKDGKWYIGALHYHQWTHGGKDYQHWFLSGKKDLAEEAEHAAYVKFDIASKLVDGKNQFLLGIHSQLKEYKKQILGKEKWESDIRKTLIEWKVLYMSTILASNGAGIIFRVEIPSEISANALTQDCHKMGKTLKATDWFKRLDGFKCSYVMKGENPNKEGRLGGIYLTQDQIGNIEK